MQAVPAHGISSIAAGLSFLTEPERKTAIGGEYGVAVPGGGPANGRTRMPDMTAESGTSSAERALSGAGA
jgi:hypothetical protein